LDELVIGYSVGWKVRRERQRWHDDACARSVK
jgi:hypothetical protein